jgi:hypothetical protein
VRQWLSHWVWHFLPLVVKQWGCVVRVDSEGTVIGTLMDVDGTNLHTVSAVTEHNDRLYLGSLGGNYVSVLTGVASITSQLW